MRSGSAVRHIGKMERVRFKTRAGNAYNAVIAINQGASMATLTIRNVDDAIKQMLRIRAARHGVSMEEEVRRILRDALVRGSHPHALGQRLKQRFADVAAADFELPARQPSRRPPSWHEARDETL